MHINNTLSTSISNQSFKQRYGITSTFSSQKKEKQIHFRVSLLWFTPGQCDSRGALRANGAIFLFCTDRLAPSDVKSHFCIGASDGKCVFMLQLGNFLLGNKSVSTINIQITHFAANSNSKNCNFNVLQSRHDFLNSGSRHH